MKPSICLRLVLSAALLTAWLSTSRPAAASGPRCYVDVDAGEGANNGTSWTDAYVSLQSALANLTCTEIWVAEGWYTPTSGTDRTASFVLRSGVAIYGGFAGGETLFSQRDIDVHHAILNGDLNGDDDNFDHNGENSYHVVRSDGADATAILDGISIFGGNANGSFPENSGGGMLNITSSPTLANVVFGANSAVNGASMYNFYSSPSLTNVGFVINHCSGNGAGIYNRNSHPTAQDLWFITNVAAGFGGGIYNGAGSNMSIHGGSFDSNTAGMGGGIYIESSNPTITGMVFNTNTAAGSGGGIAISSGSPHLMDVDFYSNSTDGNGGGAAIYGSDSQVVFQSVEFHENSALHGGAVLLSAGTLTITDSLFDGNMASVTSGSGGGILNDSGTLNIFRTTFYGNGATNGGGLNTSAGEANLTDVTFSTNWANAGGAVFNSHTDLTIDRATFDENSSTGGGGGLYNNNGGPDPAQVSLTNVTFSGNTAVDGGGIYNNGPLEITNATFSGNTTADPSGSWTILTATPLTIRNSILWNSTLWANTNLIVNTGTDPVEIHDSVVQGGACPTAGWTCSNIRSDLPYLGPLQDNGGFTETMAITSGYSSALDHGNNATCVDHDQRGTVRPQDGNLDGTAVCDIGAYELQLRWYLFLPVVHK